MVDSQRLEARSEGPRQNHGADAASFCGCSAAAEGRSTQIKRLFNFDERSRYVIENKGSAKRTKPNEADFCEGEIQRNRAVLCGPTWAVALRIHRHQSADVCATRRIRRLRSFHESLREIADPTGQGSAPADEGGIRIKIETRDGTFHGRDGAGGRSRTGLTVRRRSRLDT
jgi:hypothetical protein